MTSKRLAGPIMFVGSLVLLLLFQVAEFLYPDYSVSRNYISDLGVGPMPSSAIFAGALITFGILSIAAALLLRRGRIGQHIWLFIAASGTGALGVAAFNENSIPGVHALFAALAFLAGNTAALYSYRIVSKPLSWAFVALGMVGVMALAFVAVDVNMGLGPGGMERLTFYPALLWSLGFGAYLSNDAK